MERVFASFGLGVLLFVAWCCIIVFTSQDFPHEGPNSAWFAPIEWWSGIISESRFLRAIRARGPNIFPVVGFSVLVAPFITLFSLISFSLLRLVQHTKTKS